MARVKTFEYEELSADMQKLAEGYMARDASWDHIRVLAHRPEIYKAYYPFIYALHTEGKVEPELKELVRLRIADLNQCLF
jgi:alkylhydroperoxidase family enzyme